MKLRTINKKASILDPIIWIISAFIILLFFAIWIYGHNTLTNKLMAVGTKGSAGTAINVTDATTKTFKQVDSNLGVLKWMAFAMMIAMIISIFISNFLVKAHPVFFAVYVFICVVAIAFAAIISNVYVGLLDNSVIGATLTTFKAGGFVMRYLPTWTTVVALFGALFLFLGIIRDRGSGEGVM